MKSFSNSKTLKERKVKLSYKYQRLLYFRAGGLRHNNVNLAKHPENAELHHNYTNLDACYQ